VLLDTFTKRARFPVKILSSCLENCQKNFWGLLFLSHTVFCTYGQSVALVVSDQNLTSNSTYHTLFPSS